MAKPPTSVRSIRLEDRLWAQIGERAEADGFTVNAWVAIKLHGALNPDAAQFVVREGAASKRAAQFNAERERNGALYRQLAAPTPKGKK